MSANGHSMTHSIEYDVKPEPRPTAPENRANIFSRITFSWISSVLRKGYRRPLEGQDIPPLHPDRSVHDHLAGVVRHKYHTHRERDAKFPVWWALYDTFKREFWIGGACRGVADVLLVVIPYTLRYLIQFVMDAYQAGLENRGGPPIVKGIGLLAGIAAMLLVQTLSHNQFMYTLGAIGGESRAALVSMIFDKSLQITGRGISQDVKGENNQNNPTVDHLTSLVSVDCNRVDRATTAIHMLWTCPLSLCIAIAMLIVNLKVSALAGLGLLLVGFILLIVAVGVLFQQRKGIDKITESRVGLIRDVLDTVKLVKYLAWEDGFVRRICEIRGQETRRMQKFQAVRNIVAATSQSLPVLTAMVSFVTYANISKEGLSPAVVFSSVALFTSLRMPLIYLPLCLQGCIDTWAALLRVQNYLSIDNPPSYTYEPGMSAVVDVQNATFAWNDTSAASDEASSTKEEITVPLPIAGEGEESAELSTMKSDFRLQDIDFRLRRGELVAVIGLIGAGKSALISALMGEMTRTSGMVAWGTSYAFCPQQPWMHNATVRDNILFGQPFDGRRYKDVLRACSLERDLDMLIRGDATVIGEKGVVLSGGQKQRISLARAIYSQAEVLLLDDPLSAVDANVGREIFDNGICGPIAAGRARLLCTHDTSILRRCNRVLWLEDGRIRALDTYGKLVTREPEFTRRVAAAQKEAVPLESEDEESYDDEDGRDDSRGSTHAKEKASSETGTDKLMQDEDRAIRSVPWSVYISLIQWSKSAFLAFLCIPLLFLAQGSTVLASLWLSWWSSHRFAHLTMNQYIAIYVALAVGQTIFTYLFGFTLAVFCTRSSQATMRRAVSSVLNAPMAFFDTTPLGRHMNRFSTDVEVTDYALTEALRMFLTSLSGLTAMFAVIIVYFPWFAIAAGSLTVFLTFMAYYYRKTARETKRLESTFRSVVFARFMEGVNGASSIRTYGQDTAFGRQLGVALDDANAVSFTTYAVQRWLGIRTFVLVDRFEQKPAVSALVLSLMLNAVQVLQVVVREWADVEGAMNAVERLHTYAAKLPQEQGPHDDTKDRGEGQPTTSTSHDWLHTGEVKFDNVRLRYRTGQPESLKKVNLHVRAGEHVAIVGRTGAGKSSMVNALFRLTEPSGGSISIDSTNTANLSPRDLRGAISIIPQEANLFSGTIRSNLDPFDALPDERLWEALRRAGDLNESVSSLSDVVLHDGANLSQGQRQLLALARVLVRYDNRILVCDEATAALDTGTDERIQRVLRTAFRDCTVICIAHRLRTVLWYDRVFVMEAGQVAEEGSPLELFRRQGGFSGRCTFMKLSTTASYHSPFTEKLYTATTKTPSSNSAPSQHSLPLWQPD
ncbi:P-loop containing nucleoside triphosphate hydrolase protein [Xylariomycetidae sp. FL2044]|nr:P-loop containing nucleoside triphosphate hydrolase protein [Xylariomycetidae sp. FL2044]